MQNDPLLFNLVFKVNGKSTNCGIKKMNTGNEDSYLLCARINGEQQDFLLDYNSEAHFFFFKDPNTPHDLKSAEATISNAIHAQAKSDLLHFMNTHLKDHEE